MQDQNIEDKEETPTAVQAPSISVLPAAKDRWQNRTVISKIRGCFIEVLHHDADPSVWIVRRWKKSLWFKKRISSDWFINRQQAFAYADEMRQNYTRHHGIRGVKEI
jgi:hypothetical protein